MNRSLLREWVRAEIEYALASREDGEDGHRRSAVKERQEADRLFEQLGQPHDCFFQQQESQGGAAASSPAP